jgi:hypothetical protein
MGKNASHELGLIRRAMLQMKWSREKRRINRASEQTKEKENRVKNISQTLVTTYQTM